MRVKSRDGSLEGSQVEAECRTRRDNEGLLSTWNWQRPFCPSRPYGVPLRLVSRASRPRVCQNGTNNCGQVIVSIGVCMWNRCELLRTGLEATTHLTIHLEELVVNRNCTDQTDDVMKSST